MTTAADFRDPQSALERLAAALDPAEFATALVTRPGHRPCLTVTSRHALGAEEHIYVGQSLYWTSAAEPIGPTGDPLTAAHNITTTLRAVSQPTDDW
jgi:hypothetical protein